MPTLQIRLLGDFQLLHDGDLITNLNRVRLQSLLAYLVLHRDAPQSRQRLAFLFWPDSNEAQARANLRRALYDLRAVLPALEDFLRIDSQALQWRPDAPFDLDVTVFEGLLAQVLPAGQSADVQAALEQAVTHYAGDLLPACYDEWVLHERERLRQRYLSALEQLVHLLEDRREYQAALSYAQRLLRLDTLPAPHPAPAPIGGELSLVGWQREWKALQSGWQIAVRGQPHFVLIAGEAGIGKTRLAEELLQWADRQGFATAKTRSYAQSPTGRAQMERGWLVEVTR